MHKYIRNKNFPTLGFWGKDVNDDHGGKGFATLAIKFE